MARPIDPRNDYYRSYFYNNVYVHLNRSLYDTKTIRADAENGCLNYSPCPHYPIMKALSSCNIDHEFNWDAILPIVEAARNARAACGANVKLVFPDWLTPPLVVVFPNNDWRVVSGQDRLQVMRLLGETAIDVNVIRDADMEGYRIPLPSVVQEDAEGMPEMRVVARLVQKKPLTNPGNSGDTDKLTTAYVMELLRLQVMFEASGYTIAQARTAISKFKIPLEFPWDYFDKLDDKLHQFALNASTLKGIKALLLSDPDMNRQKDHRAWKEKAKQICMNLIWLSAARGQAQKMQKAPHFMGARLRREGSQYRTREDYLIQVVLKRPAENGEEISLLGLTRIAMLSAVNPADLWPSWEFKRHELEFAAAVGCLSNLQPALLKPATAQAAGEIYRRARTAPSSSCTEEQLVATMLVDRLEKTCVKQDFVDAARLAIRNREPVLISLADNILPSRLVVESQSEVLRRAMNSDSGAAAS